MADDVVVRFLAEAVAYDRLASASSYDYAAMWQAKPGAVRRLRARLKRESVVGNPIYERIEGIVAGVPSLRFREQYRRAVSDGRVTRGFEIQEAVTFLDGASGAFRDLEPKLLARDAKGTRAVLGLFDTLRSDLAGAAAGTRVVDPDAMAIAPARSSTPAGRSFRRSGGSAMRAPSST